MAWGRVAPPFATTLIMSSQQRWGEWLSPSHFMGEKTEAPGAPTNGGLSLRMGVDSFFTSDSLVPNTSHSISLSLSLFLCKMGTSILALLAKGRKK